MHQVGMMSCRKRQKHAQREGEDSLCLQEGKETGDMVQMEVRATRDEAYERRMGALPES
jgi:hypothetical protein